MGGAGMIGMHTIAEGSNETSVALAVAVAAP